MLLGIFFIIVTNRVNSRIGPLLTIISSQCKKSGSICLNVPGLQYIHYLLKLSNNYGIIYLNNIDILIQYYSESNCARSLQTNRQFWRRQLICHISCRFNNERYYFKEAVETLMSTQFVPIMFIGQTLQNM